MFSYSEFKHEYTKSAFPYLEPISSDYRVFVSGKEVPVYTCRISAYPFNRSWPGHQRSADQTELASFVNLVSDEPLNIEVEVKLPHETVFIKPYSKNITHTVKDGRVAFTLSENGDFVLEAGSYHHCLYIFNSKPILPPDPESVTWYFGPGVHMPGKVVLKDNESLYVDKDALVLGSIYAEDAKNIHIFGNGLFDDICEGRLSSGDYCYENYTNGNIKFYDCENITVEGVLFRNSAIFCASFFHCFDVVLDGIKIFGQWCYNSDGIDIVNSQRVIVKNSFVHSFDDTISLKAIDRYALTDVTDVSVENCTLWCDWGRTCEIGFETACREYKNISFRNCDVLRGGSVAIDIQNGDCAEVHHLLFENIRVEYNSFDTAPEIQVSDDKVYTRKDEMAEVRLIQFSNYRFREQYHTVNGVPFEWNKELDLTGIEIGGVHDIICRDITVYYDERIPMRDGKLNVPIEIESSLEGVEFYNIEISNVVINGNPLTRENALLTTRNVRNLTFNSGDRYEQLKKNNVSAENQLKPSHFVTFLNPEGKGRRILFLGNSMTLHGVAKEIGWNSCHGMAASSPEKDYVHLIAKHVNEIDPEVAFCICQAAEWERNYQTGENCYPLFENARAFNADIIIMRVVENCPASLDVKLFEKSLASLLDYLNPSGKAKIILTTGFWQHPGDAAIRAYGASHKLPIVELGDLGNDDSMKAIGKFEHTGVANHPGDLGMEKMAERILEQLDPLL